MSTSRESHDEWQLLVWRQERERLELDIMQATEMAGVARRLGYDGDVRGSQQRAATARARLDEVVRYLAEHGSED